MWTRAELKNYAKDFLRKNYWKAFIVCLVFTLLTGSGSTDSGGNDSGYDIEYDVSPPSINQEYDGYYDSFSDSINDIDTGGVGRFFNPFPLSPLLFIGTTLFAFAVLLWVIILLFISPLITIGKNRFFLNGFKGDVDMKYLFSAFNRDEFWGIFKCMFITNIKLFLWFLLLIIPGIIKAYEYSMVPYLLTKDTNLTSSEAIEKSRQLTSGQKMNIFILDLSFIGWYLLGALLFGIGTFFVHPYYHATKARLYNVLSGNDNDTDGNIIFNELD